MKTNNYKTQLGIMEQERHKKRQQRKREQEIKRKKIADLVAYGKEKEKQFLDKLKSTYPSITDNNLDNEFASMDFSSCDNGEFIEHEYKHRIKYRHDQFQEGLMFDRSKLRYMDYRIRQGIRQIVYWGCSDGVYCWELTDPDKQVDEFTISTNSNTQINQQPKPVVYIKTQYLKKFL